MHKGFGVLSGQKTCRSILKMLYFSSRFTVFFATRLRGKNMSFPNPLFPGKANFCVAPPLKFNKTRENTMKSYLIPALVVELLA